MKINEEYTQLTIDYIKNTDKNHQKIMGQYFTPKSIREELLKRLPITKKEIKILDPACGTGEFLLSASKYFKKAKLYGWDIEKKLVDIAKEIVPKADLKVKDSLSTNIKNQFDIVIGNPPYFEFKPSGNITSRFKEVVNGRVNIFNLFIKLGLDLLKNGGYLAYVVPPSMNNGAYFSKLREYIINNGSVKNLSILNSPKLFHNALQSVMILIIRKGKNDNKFIFKKNGITIFTRSSDSLTQLFMNKTTLKDLGFKVKTGRIVWNKNKDILTNDSRAGIPLIWARNITSKGLKFNHDNKKPQHIKLNDYDIGPAIVVNRIIGSVGNGKLKAAVIPERMKFVAENHVNVIFPPEKDTQMIIDDNPKYSPNKINLDDIVEQFKSDKQIEIIKFITGNTQISKNELENLFPLDV